MTPVREPKPASETRIGRQDPVTGRIDDRPVSWPCRIVYLLMLLAVFLTLLRGWFR